MGLHPLRAKADGAKWIASCVFEEYCPPRTSGAQTLLRGFSLADALDQVRWEAVV